MAQMWTATGALTLSHYWVYRSRFRHSYSIPAASISEVVAEQQVATSQNSLSALCLHDCDSRCQSQAAAVIELQESLQLVIAKWPHLPIHLKQAILSIVSGGQ